MPKIKLERVTGVVALSYLVILPVALVALHQKHRKLEIELEDLIIQLNEKE